MKSNRTVSFVFAGLCASGAAAANPGLDVNDVSILFSGRHPDISLFAATSSGEPLVSRGVYDDLANRGGGLSRLDPDFYDRADQWYISGLRYDPCSPIPAAEGGPPVCSREIRLVAMQMKFFPGVRDGAIHLIYQVGQGPVPPSDPIAADLMAIKRASEGIGAPTTGVPMNVHPGLALEREEGGSVVGDLVKAFVLEHLRSGLLIEASSTTPADWFFFQGNITPDKRHWQQTPIFNTSSRLQQIDGLSVRPGTGSIAPAITLRGDSEDAINYVLNPRLAHPRTMDCASCHLAAKAVGGLHLSGFPNYFENPSGVTGFTEKRSSSSYRDSDFRMFGYRLGEPRISWLTANASAHAADSLNRSQGWDNPSNLDCRAPAVRECFATEEGTAASCLALCRPRARR